MKRIISLLAGICLSIIFAVAIMPCGGHAASNSISGPEQSAISSLQPSSVQPGVALWVSQAIKNDISEPLGSVAPIPPSYQPGMHVRPLFRRTPPLFKLLEPDPVVQDFFTPADQGYKGPLLNIPETVLDFEGISNGDNSTVLGSGYIPPDTNGDVGLTHYVQWVNSVFAIYNKSGAKLFGPAAGNSLWSGFGGPCETTNDGDVIALYDRQADRWFMSQFALPNYPTGGPFYQCIAISQTGDPTGSWYRYAFLFSNTKINDYPKFGIWPDGYYMSANQFSVSGHSAGAGVVAFERNKMLQGLAAQMVYFDLSTTHPQLFGLLPSHLNGPNAPPVGSPNYFVKFDDNALGFPADQLEIWAFHVDWTTSANSTFSLIATLPTAIFDSNLCNYGTNLDCIPQPGTTSGVDGISDRLMYRLQYRNFGPYEAMVVNHTVDTNGSDHAGIRWYELRKSGSGWSILQQGTYSPDSDHRWMGSAALDGMDNLALGYSVSSGTTYPSIRYTGRLSTDALNTLPQGEGTIIAGGGSQTSTSSRWVDYSSMSIDPVDDATFWYTQEYYSSTSDHGWRTRVGAFSLCSFGPARSQGLLYSSTLQEAYANAASSGDTIFAQSVTFRENLNLNGNKAIMLKGGYDCLYSANLLRTTLIGSLTVSTGSVTVENLSIQ